MTDWWCTKQTSHDLADALKRADDVEAEQIWVLTPLDLASMVSSTKSKSSSASTVEHQFDRAIWPQLSDAKRIKFLEYAGMEIHDHDQQ